MLLGGYRGADPNHNHNPNIDRYTVYICKINRLTNNIDKWNTQSKKKTDGLGTEIL